MNIMGKDIFGREDIILPSTNSPIDKDFIKETVENKNLSNLLEYFASFENIPASAVAEIIETNQKQILPLIYILVRNHNLPAPTIEGLYKYAVEETDRQLLLSVANNSAITPKIANHILNNLNPVNEFLEEDMKWSVATNPSTPLNLLGSIVETAGEPLLTAMAEAHPTLPWEYVQQIWNRSNTTRPKTILLNTHAFPQDICEYLFTTAEGTTLGYWAKTQLEDKTKGQDETWNRLEAYYRVAAKHYPDVDLEGVPQSWVIEAVKNLPQLETI